MGFSSDGAAGWHQWGEARAAPCQTKPVLACSRQLQLIHWRAQLSPSAKMEVPLGKCIFKRTKFCIVVRNERLKKKKKWEKIPWSEKREWRRCSRQWSRGCSEACKAGISLQTLEEDPLKAGIYSLKELSSCKTYTGARLSCRTRAHWEDPQWSRGKAWRGSSCREDLLWTDHSLHSPSPLHHLRWEMRTWKWRSEVELGKKVGSGRK